MSAIDSAAALPSVEVGQSPLGDPVTGPTHCRHAETDHLLPTDPLCSRSVSLIDQVSPGQVPEFAPPDRPDALSWLGRLLPARLLEMVLRILRATETTQAEAALHNHAGAAGHERTQQMIGELGTLLERFDATRVSAELAASAAAQRYAAVPRRGAPTAPLVAEVAGAVPSLEVHLLGPFRVFANDHPIEAWPNGKGKSLFKFLATHRDEPVPKEVLMETFWAESEPDAARNNLNVAVYGLRKALAQADSAFPFVLFRQGGYSFNPALQAWIDAEVFADCICRGRRADRRGDVEEAVASYRVAMAIYRSPLLVDDRYEDWLIPQRQALQEDHAIAMQRLAAHDFAAQDYESCAAVASRMLDSDNCNEEAHRMLMRCHSRMGQTHLALRQYHFCVDALARELKTIPNLETVALFQQIRLHQPI